MIKKHLILILYLFISFVVQAQDPLSIHIGEENGLPDKIIYRMLEDKDGLIWLAANSGLYSFNGEKYVKYTHPKLVRSSVFGLKLDKKGRIWFNNMGGEFYYVENGKTVLFMNLKEHIGEKLVTFEIIDNNIVFVDKYRYKIDIDTKVIDRVKLYNSQKSLYYNYKGKEYYYQDDALHEIKKGSHVMHFKTAITEKEELLSNMFSYREKLYMLSQRRNINSFFEINESGIKPVNDFNAISRIAISHLKKIKNNYWFFTVNGAYEYGYVDGKLVLKNHYLKEKRVTDLIIDRNKNYIFSTLNNGLYVIPDLDVKEYKTEAYKEDLISHFVAVNDYTINYISNNNKLHSVNLKTKKSVSRNIDYFKEQRVYYDKLKNQGLFFNGGFIEVYNPANLKVTKQLIKYTPKDIKRLNDSLFITSNYDRTKILNNNLEGKIAFNGRSGSLTTTKSGHYYVNTARGLKWGTIKERNLENVLHDNTKLYMRKLVTKTNTDSVWISRPNWGLYLMKNGKILKTIFKSEKGLLDKNIRAMATDEENLWIATNKGIQRYNYETESFINYSISDGIIHPRILKLQVTDNYVWYQTSNGIYQFPKTKQKKKICVPEIYFSEIKIENKLQEIKENYKIDYDANALGIKFMVNGLNVLNEYQFEYKVEGLNPEWITLEQGKHEVDFNSLPSRKYIIKARAKNILEGTYTNTIQFKADVTLPFWKRWWFGALIAIIGLASVIVFFKIKAKHKEEQKENELEQVKIKHQLVALKLENLRSQMNPHFIFNALNSIQEYIMLNQKKLASDYLGKFADLMRAYLRHSSKGRVPLQEEIDCLEMYLELEKLRFEDKLTYSIKNDILEPNNIYIPTMLIQPYVENALKHGLLHRKENRILKIDFSLHEALKTIKCSIVDNGVGRTKAKEYKERSYKQHKSFATKANQDRLDLLNYGKEKQIGVTITDLLKEETAIGTQVDIIIPYENI